MTLDWWSQNLRRLLGPKSTGSPGRGKGRGRPPGLPAGPCWKRQRQKITYCTLFMLNWKLSVCVEKSLPHWKPSWQLLLLWYFHPSGSCSWPFPDLSPQERKTNVMFKWVKKTKRRASTYIVFYITEPKNDQSCTMHFLYISSRAKQQDSPHVAFS